MSSTRHLHRRIIAAVAVGTLALVGCSSSPSAAPVTVTADTTVAPSSAEPTTSAAEVPATSEAPAPSSQEAPPPAPSASPSSSAAPSSPAVDAPPPRDTSQDTVEWADNSMVPHIFFHSLVIDAPKAFADPESGAGYLDYMVTQDEFSKVLQQVYDNGYVLVSPHQLATVNPDGTMTPKPLMLPPGKKPLVVSIDDVSYYEYMEGDGFPTNLFVAENGRVLNNYTDANGNTVQGSYDVMPMIDDFVRLHPDFSHDGARGVIALTGYNGVFGYRSSPSEYAGKNPNLDADIATAKQVADALKAEGWEFASHSWGHINFTNSSVGSIQADTEKWKSDVEPITGPTDLLIYPFGADISGVPGYAGDKFEYLKGAGYNFFFNVDGSTPAWGQWGDRYLREARINIDGISLKAAMAGRPVLGEFFDPASVIDPARPATIAGS